MQESSGALEVFRQAPVPGSEHPADTAVEVLWRPGARVQEVKERLRVSGGTKWIGGSREKSVRVKEKLRVHVSVQAKCREDANQRPDPSVG